MSKYTKDKYLKAMKLISNGQEFNAKYYLLDNRLDSGMVRAMMELGLVIKVSVGRYKWIANREPLASDVKMIQKSLKARRLLLQSQNGNGQLKLTPIKRVERTQPAPVHEEAECDNSNSKMLLIMAVGAVIGFMIATAIWK
jgi:hypothetical protein